MYTISTYYFSKLLVEMPIILIQPLIFNCIFYFAVGFTATASQFFQFYLGMFLMSFCANSLGYFISAVFTNDFQAAMVMPIILLPIYLFGGFYSNLETMPVWTKWISYVSPLRYAFEALVRVQYEPLNIPTDQPNPIVYLNLTIGKFKCFIILAGMSIALRIISLICLRLMVTKPQ